MAGTSINEGRSVIEGKSSNISLHPDMTGVLKLPQFPSETSIRMREKMERFATITPITSANGF